MWEKKKKKKERMTYWKEGNIGTGRGRIGRKGRGGGVEGEGRGRDLVEKGEVHRAVELEDGLHLREEEREVGVKLEVEGKGEFRPCIPLLQNGIVEGKCLKIGILKSLNIGVLLWEGILNVGIGIGIGIGIL